MPRLDILTVFVTPYTAGNFYQEGLVDHQPMRGKRVQCPSHLAINNNFGFTADTVGFSLSKHMSLNAGDQTGLRLVVNSASNRFGVQLTQKGPVAGMEFSF